MLITEEDYPPDGQIHMDLAEHRLVDRTGAPGAGALDLLIERSTHLRPDARPSLREFADSMAAWGTPAMLRNDQVRDVRRRRYLDLLGDVLAQGADLDVLSETEVTAKALIREAQLAINTRQREATRLGLSEYAEIIDHDLRSSGVRGVARRYNTPWIGNMQQIREFSTAVMYQPEPLRDREVRTVWPTVEAIYEPLCDDGAYLLRPFGWLHTVVLAGCLDLRNVEGCESVATEFVRRELVNHLLAFRDDPLGAAASALNRTLVPAICRMTGQLPIRQLTEALRGQFSAEDILRLRINESGLYMLGVRGMATRWIATIEPWTRDKLLSERERLAGFLPYLPVPPTGWVGPMSDPWLESWLTSDPLLACALDILANDPRGDDLIDHDMAEVIIAAASDDGVEGIARGNATALVRRLELGS